MKQRSYVVTLRVGVLAREGMMPAVDREFSTTVKARGFDHAVHHARADAGRTHPSIPKDEWEAQRVEVQA